MLFHASNLVPIIPEIILAVSALLLLILSAFKGNESCASIIRFAIIALSLVLVLMLMNPPSQPISVLNDMFVANRFNWFVKILIILGSIFSLILALGYYRDHKQQRIGEFAVIVLLSVVGMMLMVSANELIALYVGLELQSLALYILASINRDQLRSSEAGLKYFVLGSLSSGILLFGCSLIYGFSGTTHFDALATLYPNIAAVPIGTLVGVIMLVVGLCFKISAVPFHMWTPDVYEGSPTAVTVFFSVAPKIAALSLFVRVLVEPFGDITAQWQQIIIFVSAASMVIGALGALKQTNIKRLLAYSSIGHVGYALVGLASGTEEGIRAVLIYLAIYGSVSLGAFAVVMMMRNRDGLTEDITSISGLAKTRPFIALAMAVLLFSMAGIPPFAGFFGKFFVFQAALSQELYTLAIIGVLSSVVSAFYYLRIIKIMYFDEATVALELEVQPETKFIATASTVFNLMLFAVFTPLLIIAEHAAKSLF